MNALNRRGEPRLPLQRPAYLLRLNGDVVPAEGEDLSASGMALTCSRWPAHNGERLRVELQPHGEAPELLLAGQIVYVAETGDDPPRFKVGITFDELRPEIQQRLQEWLGGSQGGGESAREHPPLAT